jgi:plasmid stability protein
MQDISHWPGDRRMLPSQLLALGEIAIRAARHGRGLVETSVRDIEWDGERLE